jgi:branched-chain amino acid transport system permease protein
MDSSRQLFQYILSGLSNGAIYALIGFGFAIIYNSTGIINFAQGEFVMLGGMLTVFFLTVLRPAARAGNSSGHSYFDNCRYLF